jgi:hypothetical protein
LLTLAEVLHVQAMVTQEHVCLVVVMSAMEVPSMFLARHLQIVAVSRHAAAMDSATINACVIVQAIAHEPLEPPVATLAMDSHLNCALHATPVRT